MAFEAEYILYDGISSERFGLRLFNDNGGLDAAAGSSFSILRAPLQAGLKYVYLGRNEQEPISLTLKLASQAPIGGDMQGEIYKWLIGKKEYKELQIMQPDMSSLRIGCIFHEINYLQNGNITVGIEVTGECDSCFFREEDIVQEITGTSGEFTVTNSSDNNDYIYPIVKIIMPPSGGDIFLTNTSDNNRETVFSSITGDEIITVDCVRKIITSSESVRRLSSFNKIWPRLLPGENVFNFDFTGGYGTIQFTSPVYRMVCH